MLSYFRAQFANDEEPSKFRPPVTSSSKTELESRRRLNNHLTWSICDVAFRNHMAEVIVEVAKPRVMEIVKDVRVTFPDMLGTVGGTISLFTGLSLISAVEIVYWMYKTIVAYFSTY